MKLSVEEIGLLRSLVEWRRANGWSHERRWQDSGRDQDGAPWGEGWRVERWSDGKAEVEVWFEPNEDDRWLVLNQVLYRDDDGEDFAVWDGKLASRLGFSRLLDAIVATADLPARFSSAFAAGKASVYDRIEYRVATTEGNRPGSTYPIYSAIEAFKWLGFWRRNGWTDAYLERRFDKEPSEWGRVVEEVSDADS